MTSISTIKETLTSDTCIEEGYGEYILYTSGSTSIKKLPLTDQKTYEKCYQVLLQAKQITAEKEKREFLKRELTQIDPTIHFFFIPRTLYELYFIEKCIKETLRLGEICKNIKFERIDSPKPRCWHGAYFNDFGNDQDPIIIDMAYRLNKSIVRHLQSTTPGALCYEQITKIANEKLEYLEDCHEDSGSPRSKELLNISDSTGGITNNMICESERGRCKPLGIQTLKMKELVLNAIALECSKVAKGKLILYRGSTVLDDKPLEYGENGKVTFVQSLSYGTSLFAGGMHDPGATVFRYARKADKDAVALLIPHENLADSPFAIPTSHPLCQIFGRGEKWHARSRAPTIDVDPKTTMGCKNGMSIGKVESVPEHFQIAATPEEFVKKFQYYMKNSLVDLKDKSFK